MTSAYRSILFATDLSTNAAHALRHALTLAHCQGAAVQVVHVMPEMDATVVNYVATVMGEERFVGYELAHEEEVRRSIERWLDGLGLAADERACIRAIEVHHGSPVVEILEAAERCDADLVVMGCHGKGALRYAFLGSVAEKVVRKSLRPVMLVPLSAEALRR